jgi:hypothetical protein
LLIVFAMAKAEPLAGRDIAAALAEPGGWYDDHQVPKPIESGVAGVFADLLRETAGEARERGACISPLPTRWRLVGGARRWAPSSARSPKTAAVSAGGWA